MSIPRKIFICILNFALYTMYCRQVKIFRRRIGYFPNIAVPNKYFEKMLWRKIFDHNPLFIVFSDKLATKKFIKEKLPHLNVPNVVWSSTNINDLQTNIFNVGVVVKANHGSGFNYFPSNKQYDTSKIIDITRKWLGITYGKEHFEWAYFFAKKEIFCEQRLLGCNGNTIKDYFIRCADGKAIFASVKTGCKTINEKTYYFYPNGEKLIIHGGPHSVCETYPNDLLGKSFFDAVQCAEELSKGIDYARYDFMDDGELYGGEITVYPGAGIGSVTPDGLIGADTLANAHWDLKKSWFLRTPQSGWKKIYAGMLASIL